MVTDSPLSYISALQYLGKIEGTTNSPIEVSLGTLSIGTGTFKNFEKILIFYQGFFPATLSSSVKCRITSNSVNFDISPSILATGVDKAAGIFIITTKTQISGNDSVSGLFFGARGTSTAIANVGEQDFNLNNWITQSFDIDLRAADTASTSVYHRFDIYKTGGM